MTARARKAKARAQSRVKDAQVASRAILERMAARDKKAVLELYAGLAPMMLGITSQIAADSRDAVRAVEESFVRFWREAARFPRDGASVAVWLALEARRIALEQRGGAHTRDSSAAADGRSPETYSWLPSQETVAQLESRRELLKKTLRQLPKHQQDALALAVWEGLSEQAVAEKLGEPLAKVQSSLRAGMRFIRHRMSVVLGKWSAPI